VTGGIVFIGGLLAVETDLADEPAGGIVTKVVGFAVLVDQLNELTVAVVAVA